MKISLFVSFAVLLGASTAFADTTPQPQSPLPCVEEAASNPGARAQSDFPWGIAIAGSFSKQEALDEFAEVRQRYADLLEGYPRMLVPVCDLSMGFRMRYSARVGLKQRDAAERICTKLQAQGGACIVLKN